ncbi:nucleotidyltransferase domain-containing protein [Lachnospiraceae bacterium AM48-27BH]|nr:nucleotidyltransferase domain-containing protein [Lachnospiraceae bacterium AM48-27BH]
MPAAKREIIMSFARKVRRILGKNLKQVILYGSYARGDYTEDSDIDIMVLTTLTDKEIEQIETEIYDLAFDYLMDYGVDISVVIKNEEQFNYWLGALPFYDNVRKEGMVLNG